MRRFALLVMLAAACGGRHEAAVPSSVACTRVVGHLVDLEIGKLTVLPAAMVKPVPGATPGFRAALMKSCANDRWSEGSISCLAQSKSADEAKGCASSFAAGQEAHVEDAYRIIETPVVDAINQFGHDVADFAKRMCACTDAACRAAVQHDYDRMVADARTSPNADIKRTVAIVDRKLAACQGSAAGSAAPAK